MDRCRKQSRVNDEPMSFVPPVNTDQQSTCLNVVAYVYINSPTVQTTAGLQ